MDRWTNTEHNCPVEHKHLDPAHILTTGHHGRLGSLACSSHSSFPLNALVQHVSTDPSTSHEQRKTQNEVISAQKRIYCTHTLGGVTGFALPRLSRGSHAAMSQWTRTQTCVHHGGQNVAPMSHNLRCLREICREDRAAAMRCRTSPAHRALQEAQRTWLAHSSKISNVKSARRAAARAAVLDGRRRA